MKDLHISILTRSPLGERNVALPLLRLLTRAHEDLYPQRFGSFEPLPGRLTPKSDITAVLTDWRAPMLFSNGRRSSVSFWFGNNATHDTIFIDCLSSRVSAEVAAGLTRDLAVASDADLAVAYYWRGEREEWLSRYKAVYPMCLGLTTHQLRRSLPDLAWYSEWGPPYVELFGRDRLATCPAFRSSPVSNRYWEVQLTETLSMPSLSKWKSAAQAHLGIDCFLDLAAPERQQRVPAFDWASPVHNRLEGYLRANGLIDD